MSDRNAEFHSQQHDRRISRSAEQIGAVDFFNLLTGPELLEMTDALLPEHRERLYPPTLALSMFMVQVLSEDGSCQKAVDGWRAAAVAMFRGEHLSDFSVGNSENAGELAPLLESRAQLLAGWAVDDTLWEA